MGFRYSHILAYAFCLASIFVCLNTARAKTTVDSTQNPKFTGVTLSDREARRFAKDFQDMVNTNGPHFANSYYLQNVLGYTVGTPHISNMDFGLVAGFSEANGDYFAGTAKPDSYPALTPVVNFRFGMALSSRSDIVAKFSVLDMYMIDTEPTVSDVTVDDYRQFAIGAKFRYMVLGPQRLLPFLFNFEGLTCGVGGDIMTGYMGVVGDYNISMPQTSIDPGSGTAQLVDTYLEGEYNATMRMLQLTVCGEAIGYFRVVRALTFYTGGNLSLGWSWFGIEADSTGELMAADDTLDADIGNGFDYRSDYLMELEYDSRTMFYPFPLMPVYIVGIEYNAAPVKIGLESAVNMYNRKDVALLLSVRYEM
ncbi:MAG: hypothetical protein ACOC2H_08860 [Spirochaetota bacterium]